MDEVAEGEADASPIGLPENNTPTENISLSIKQVGNSPLRAPRTIQVNYATAAKIAAGLLTRVEGVELRPGETVRFGSGIRALVKMNGELEALPPEFNKIPDFMAERRQFCLRGGADNKQPIIREWQPGSKKAFTSTGWDDHPECLMTLREAFHEYLARKNEFKGIGYLNGKTENQITGIDLDACIDPETGEISSFAIDFLNRIKPFYIETSPSGVGLRAFCLGKLPGDLNMIAGAGSQDLTELTKERILAVKPSLREKKGPKFNCIELYQAHRHLSLTGEYLCGFEAVDRTGELAEAIKSIGRPLPTSEKEAYEMHFTKVEDLSGDSCLGYIPATEAYPETWCKISTYGHGFFIEEVGGPKKKDAPSCSQASKRRGYPEIDILQVAKSEGFIITDASGDNVLGYFPQIGSSTGKNIVIDVKKGLYCYMHNGLNTGGDAWTMLARLSGAASWEADGKGLLNDPAVRRTTIDYAVKKGYAKAESFQNGITYEDIAKSDKKGGFVLSVTKAAEAILEKMPLVMAEGDDSTIYWFDGALYRPDGEDEIDALLCKLAGDQVSSKALSEVLRRVKYGLRKRGQVKLDMYPYLLGVENGVIDLRTGELIDYKPEFYITARVPIEYDPAAKCPQFFDYLEGVTPNINDRLTLIDFGAILAIKEPMPFLLFLLGLGRNGKGVYENILYKLYGEEKFAEIRIDELGDSRFAAGNLKDKWGFIITESGVSRGKSIIDTRILKKVSGGDFLDSDRKNKSRVRFRAYCKPIIDSNIMPAIDDRSKGIEERFCKVSLPYSFITSPKEDRPEEKRKDPEMYQKTTTPEELQGILNVFVERAKEILKSKEIIRRDPKKTFEEYHEQSASVNAFLERFCEYDNEYSKPGNESNSDIYQAYTEWCTVTVAVMVSERYFFKLLKEFCNRDVPVRKLDLFKSRKLRYHRGLTFYRDEFDSFMAQARERMSQRNYVDVEEDDYSKIWFDLVERFGGKGKEEREREEAKLQEARLEGFVELLNLELRTIKDVGLLTFSKNLQHLEEVDSEPKIEETILVD